jgi:hypothetical protein
LTDETIFSVLKPSNQGVEITLRDFIKLKDAENELLARKMIAQQPREMNVRIHTIGGRDHKLEKEYEWEIEVKK